jgi:iron complex transport system substrate-binding protein
VLRTSPSYAHLTVVGLLTTVNEENSRVAMHATRWSVALAQAASVGLPLWRVDLPSPCSNDTYARRMAALMAAAKARGVTHIAFGDLHLSDVRAYREALHEGTGITPVFPLWCSPGAVPALAAAMLAGGAVALTCTVDGKVPRAAALCGRVWDAGLCAELRAAGADECGERGEFHTIAYAGPAFSVALPLAPVGAPFLQGGFWYCDAELVGGAAPEGAVEVHLDAAGVEAALAAGGGDAGAGARVARAAALGEALCPTAPHAAGALRIFSTLPAGTAIAFLLGLGASVAGVTPECTHPPEAAALPRFLSCSFDADALDSGEIDAAVKAAAGGGAALFTVHTGALAAAAAAGDAAVVLAQDLCDVCGPGAAQVHAALAALPPPARHTLVTLKGTSLASMLEDVRAVARACGVAPAGEAAAAALAARVEAVRAAAAAAVAGGAARPTVACLEWLDPLYNAGHWVPELVDAAGGREVLGEAGAFSTGLPAAALARADPDVVVLMPCGFTIERTLEEARRVCPALEGWAGLRAVKAGRVWAVDGRRLFSGASPALVDGLELLHALLHGTEGARAALPARDARRVQL